MGRSMSRYTPPGSEPLVTPRQRQYGWSAALILGFGLLLLPAAIEDTRSGGLAAAPERVVLANHGNPDANRAAPPSDGLLACIRHYEATGNYHAVSKSGKYRGAYQFDRTTWNDTARGPHPDYVGADPAAAPSEIQDSMASELYRKYGLKRWSKSVKRNCR